MKRIFQRVPARRVRRGALALCLACTQLAGCNAQGVRGGGPVPDTPLPDGSGDTPLTQDVLIEPGPPPPDVALPSEVNLLERIRARAQLRIRASAALQPDSGPSDHADLWDRLRAAMSFESIDHPRVHEEIEWYRQHPEYLRRVIDRARLYLAHIVIEVEERGLPGELALLPVVESAFQPYARSPVGAAGLWQFMAPTGQRFGLRRSVWYDARRDVVESTRAALDYLSLLYKDLGEDWLLAVAAYNAGEGNVMRAVRRNRDASRETDFFLLDLPSETQAYVPRLLAIAALVADPERFGVSLDPVDQVPYFEVVETPGQIDLAKAAELAGISLNELMLLNPGFMRHATDPKGPHRLLLPAEAVRSFDKALRDSPEALALVHRSHEVDTGDSLGSIARRYGTSPVALRAANGMTGDLLKAGQRIIIPGGFDETLVAGLSASVREGMKRARNDRARTVYRVRSGDNLWLIARRHDTTVSNLRRWNRLAQRGLLRPGQRLIIRSRTSQRRAVAEGEGIPEGTPVHVVEPGDSLWSIGRRYGVSAEQLRDLNQLPRKTLLKPGQTLRVAHHASAAGNIAAAS